MKFSDLRGVFFVTVLSVCGVASAHERDGVWTYEWYVPAALEREVEFWWTDLGGGHSDIQIEFEYGVDGKYAVAPYLLIERDGDHFRTVGWKLEQRYAFGEFDYEKVLPSIYLEVKKEGDEPYELEAKAIATYALRNDVSFSANLVAEREMESGKPVEWGYAAMVSGRQGRNTFAIEALGSLTDKTSFIGPTLGTTIKPGEKVVAGYAFDMDGGPGRFRFLYEYEF